MNSFEKYLILTILFATMFTSCRINQEQDNRIKNLENQILQIKGSESA